MKKLMIVLGLVAMAAVSAQASKVKWNISGVQPYGTDEDPTGYLMVCLCESATVGTALENVYTSRSAAEAWAKSNGESGSVNNLKTGQTISFSGSKTSSAYTQSAWVSSASQTESGNFYAIILNSDDVSTATAYMITDSRNLEFSTNPSENQTVSVSPGTWTPISDVPEPTSGLLLLLGVAGLALKRKRA